MNNIAEPTPEMIEAGAISLHGAMSFNGFERDFSMETAEGKRLWRLRATHCYTAMRASAPQEPDDAIRRENADLKHDLERQMTIANIECNEAEHLRRILRAARPYISDRAGAGIIDAVNAAIQAKAPETRKAPEPTANEIRRAMIEGVHE